MDTPPEAVEAPLRESFAKRLEQVRLSFGGISVHAFAKMCGIHYSSMRNFLGGTALPDFRSLHSIAMATGTSVDSLVTGRVWPIERDKLRDVTALVVEHWLTSSLPEVSPEWSQALADQIVDFYKMAARPDKPVSISELHHLLRQFSAMSDLRERLGVSDARTD